MLLQLEVKYEGDVYQLQIKDDIQIHELIDKCMNICQIHIYLTYCFQLRAKNEIYRIGEDINYDMKLSYLCFEVKGVDIISRKRDERGKFMNDNESMKYINSYNNFKTLLLTFEDEEYAKRLQEEEQRPRPLVFRIPIPPIVENQNNDNTEDEENMEDDESLEEGEIRPGLSLLTFLNYVSQQNPEIVNYLGNQNQNQNENMDIDSDNNIQSNTNIISNIIQPNSNNDEEENEEDNNEDIGNSINNANISNNMMRLLDFISVVHRLDPMEGGVIPGNLEDHKIVLKDSEFKQLEEKSFNNMKKESYFKSIECNICLTEYDDEEMLTVLPCKHYYHTECIEHWLKKESKKCPVCKSEVAKGHILDESVDNEIDS